MTLFKNVDGERVEMSNEEEASTLIEWEPPTQDEIDAKLESQVQSNTDDLIQNDKKFRVLAELIFDTLKSGKTGNYSVFDGVVDKSTFRDHVVARFRALN